MASKSQPKPATSPRMSVTTARRIVADFGDRKLLAPRVRHMLAYTGFSTAEVAEKVFAIYASEGVTVPAGFGATSLDTAMLVARTYESELAGKGFSRDEENELFPALVCIARAQKADGGAKEGLVAIAASAGKERTRAKALGSVANAEIEVNKRANARRRGANVAATTADTPDGRAAIASHDESAAEARKGETKAERKARLSGERAANAKARKAGEGKTIGGGKVTDRTPESGPDPLAPNVETAAHLPVQNKPAPAQTNTLAGVSVKALIAEINKLIVLGYVPTGAEDAAFTNLAMAWEARVEDAPAKMGGKYLERLTHAPSLVGAGK